jgi:hypothetical protein
MGLGDLYLKIDELDIFAINFRRAGFMQSSG